MTEVMHAGLRLMIHATRCFREALSFFDHSMTGANMAGEVVARWTTKHDVTLLNADGQPMEPRRLHLFENPWSYGSLPTPSLRTFHPSLVRACTWDYDPVVFRACDWEPVHPYKFGDRHAQAPSVITGFYGLPQKHAQIQLQRQVTCPACLVLYDTLMASKS